MGFWQTPLGVFTAGIILQFVCSAFLVGRIYERFKSQGSDIAKIAFELGKLSVKVANLRDAQVAIAYFLDSKHTNPHPNIVIRKAIDILQNWEEERPMEASGD